VTGRRALHALAHLAVALWLALGLAVAGVRHAPESPRAEASARVHALPEAPAAPAASAAGEAVREVGRAEISAGRALLAEAGRFPQLSASYEDLGFAGYARAMTNLGARFAVVRGRQVVGEVALESGAVREWHADPRFSPRARDYTDEPAVAPLARTARQRFGRGAVVMMLVPRALDAGLFGGIARALAERGEGHEAYREIRGRYERAAAGGVRLRVLAALRPDGSSLPLDLVFDLGQIAATGRDA
jgi:hypothetical protein